MEIVGAEATALFVGTEEEPRQVVRARVRGTDATADGAALRVLVRGEGLTSDAIALDGLAAGASVELEVGVRVDRTALPGSTLDAELLIEGDAVTVRHRFGFVVAEPGWRMFMISHFHYDPVWWNTQAAYTESWGDAWMTRSPFQEPGLALVKAHLDMSRRDPDYKFVLAELDYLKPYWDVYPEDRELVRRLLAEGRLELMGGTYNEPNTNLTSAETTIRNAIYGVGYQRDVLGGAPATAWQLDAFGHDPQFPGIMADAGITSSSWARGPFHEWGPNWRRGSTTLIPVWADLVEPTAMQFPSEFEWISPSGRSLLTCFMANHYSAGWWMDSAPTLEQAEREVLTLFLELAAVSATRNVLLPVGTDYTPPNRWLTAIHRDWSRRYVWPKFLSAIPREFFDAVRAERAASGRGFSPQTRDMNPVYTGKDVSFIDTKQAQRAAENTLLAAEKLATIASLMGARYPSEAIDKAWRQLLFGAHHDGITGSESDQVYLDLLGGWREAMELSSAVLDGAVAHLGRLIEGSSAPGWSVAVFNALSWPREDVARVELTFAEDEVEGVDLLDGDGRRVPFVVEGVDRHEGGGIARVVLAFLARDVPALGYRTYRVVAASAMPEAAAWTAISGWAIENEHYRVDVDPDRGGSIVSLVEVGSGKQVLRAGGLGNELLAYREYPNHPLFGEGPWHLTPDGSFRSSSEAPARVVAESSPLGQRLRVTGPFEGVDREQELYLWQGIDRLDCVTHVDGFAGHDTLFRIRFGAQVEGATAVSEVANAVVGRGFGFPNVDVARTPFTLDNPAYDWFALSATARIVLVGDGATAEPRAARATSVAEVIAPDDAALDGALRDLMVALVRAGVTATLGRGDGSRYGTLAVDSNLPDHRFAVGGPGENAFTARVLDAVEPAYRQELERQLAGRGQARVWVPAERPLADTWRGDADLRAVRALPTLIVAGRDGDSTLAAIEELVRDLDDAVVGVDQPAELDAGIGSVEDYTVAVLNRGLPGFSVEPDGSLYLSLMRSCSGWPSGVWIDPPRRTVPDGSNFQFQHWSHRFEYSLVARSGDWREAEVVRAGHEYDNPLIGSVVAADLGGLPASTGFVQVEPASAVLTTLKPAGNPLARLASANQDPADGIVLRLYESTGRRTRVRIAGSLPLNDVAASDILEEGQRPLAHSGSALEVELDPFEIATLVARPGARDVGGRGDGGPREVGSLHEIGPLQEIGPRQEPAQPVFSDYWLHDKGPAPLGYQPASVQIRPGRMGGPGPFVVSVTVASSRTDGAVHGVVSIVVPPGWTARPPERPFSLAPGAHVAFETEVSPDPGAAQGRYFVAARIEDEAGQLHEDVVTVDLSTDGRSWVGQGRSPALEKAMARTEQRAAWILDDVVAADAAHGAAADAPDDDIGGELVVTLLTPEVRLAAGDRGELRLSLRNRAASEIRGEAQLISPHETWSFTSPWTQGFAVGPGEEVSVSFAVRPPSDVRAGTWWGLVKIMYFGRLWYSESAIIEVLPRA